MMELGALILLLMCFHYPHLTQTLPVSPEDNKIHHALIIDAGSTGTRANYYSFLANSSAPVGLQIVGFRTSKVKPGLSSLVGNDLAVEASILRLIAKLSPLARASDLELQATAGMRIVEMKDKEAAQHTMRILQKLLKETYGASLHICNDCVKISSGEEEGLYSFIAVNYMLGNLGKQDAKMSGIVEIGGASMQIVLPESAQMEDLCPITIPKRLQALLKQCAYSKTFLPYGMEMARHAFFKVSSACIITECPQETEIHYSPCLNSDFKQNFSLGATEIQIAGEDGVTPDQRFQKCYATIASYLRNSLKEKATPKKVSGGSIAQPVYLMGGSITKTLNELGYEYNTPLYLKDIQAYANKACVNLISTGFFEPFNCMNLVYVTGVLREAFSFNDQQVFVAAETIKNVELEWALGAALEAVANHANV